MTLEQRIAQALHDYAWVGDITSIPWESEPTDRQEIYLARARVQMEALRVALREDPALITELGGEEESIAERTYTRDDGIIVTIPARVVFVFPAATGPTP